MDFSLDNSDSWDSNRFQDKFIKTYFKKHQTQVNKRRKAISVGNQSNKPVNNEHNMKNVGNTRKKQKRKRIKDNGKEYSTDKTNPDTFNRPKKRMIEQTTSESDFDKRKPSILKIQAGKNLQAAKFRCLNEKLYTVTGDEAYQYFHNNTEEFQDYHVGYRSQVSKWPINPVDVIIKDLCKQGKSLTIADMGCGDAKIAETFPNRKVYSFDLIGLNKYVTPCNISKVPLPKEAVDIVIFCLSLMGTNLRDYLHEAFRILKLDGILKIAEVESRIENISSFIQDIEQFGFKVENKDVAHKMFVFLDFRKKKKKVKKSEVPSVSLKPCLYKKR